MPEPNSGGNYLVAFLEHRNHTVALQQETRPENKGNYLMHFFTRGRYGWEKNGDLISLNMSMQTFVHCHEQPHVPNITSKKLAICFPGWNKLSSVHPEIPAM